MPRPAEHLGGEGPLDTFLELGLPLIIFAALWLYSRRGAARRKEAERRKAAGDPAYYLALPDHDLRSLAGLLEGRGNRTPEEDAVHAGARAELTRRKRGRST